MSSKKKVQSVVVQDVALPDSVLRKRNNSTRVSSPSTSSSFSSSSSSSFSSKKRPRKEGDTRDELRGIMVGVREFNANSQLGKSRQQYAQDLLTKLGAQPLKKEKMPFKNRLRQIAAVQRREKKTKEVLIESDVVLGSKILKELKKNSKEKAIQKKKNRN